MVCLVFLEHKRAHNEAAKEEETISKASYATWGWAKELLSALGRREMREEKMGKVMPVKLLP